MSYKYTSELQECLKAEKLRSMEALRDALKLAQQLDEARAIINRLEARLADFVEPEIKKGSK